MPDKDKNIGGSLFLDFLDDIMCKPRVINAFGNTFAWLVSSHQERTWACCFNYWALPYEQI